MFTILPLYVMITSSIKPLGDVQSAFQWIPKHLTIQPFIQMWSTVPLASYFVNSIIVSAAATLFSVAIAIFAAFAVSRYKFFGRNVFTTTVLSTQMFPGILFLLPLFLIFVNIDRSLGVQLVGTRIGLIITYLTFSLPFSIWMLVGYFDGIPRELDEAAKVDGSSPLGALFRVVLPAAKPGLTAVAIYSFMTSWGEVLFASVMTTDANRTLAVGLQLYSTQTNVYWNQIMAASLIVSIPVVVGFLVLQRSFVAGLTAGAVK
nr:carbohydrate ABC transporter permease [Spelaeicoccus albus]